MTIERVITPVIKAADVRIRSPVTVGAANPILQQAEAVASAAWNRFEVPKAFHSALTDVNLDPGIEPAVSDPAQQFFENNVRILSIMPIFSPKPELVEPQQPTFTPPYPVQPRPLTETLIVSEPSWQPAIKTEGVVARYVPLPQQAPHQMVLGQAEQLTEETEIVAKTAADQDKIRLAEQQHLEEERLINVEDWQVAQQRRFEISQAIKRAWVTVKEGRIFGWMVFRFLPGQHEGNTSQLVKKKGPDGSLVDTEQAIKTDPREFTSEAKAKEGLLPFVSIFKPAKKAKEGKRLTRQEVARVVRYLLVKPSQAYEVYVKRKFKRLEIYKGDNLAPALVSEQTEKEIEEPSLESNSRLAELFQVDLTDSSGLIPES